MNTVVGIGTLALAAATFALAWVAWKTLKLTRRSVEQAKRPVVVPATASDQVVSRLGHMSDAPAGIATHQGKVVVAIENVGAGPALNVRGAAEAGGGGVIVGIARTLHPVEGLSAGQCNAVVFEPETDTFDTGVEVVIRLLYEDIANVTHATDLHYNGGSKAFLCAVIEPPVDAADSPLTTTRARTPLASWPREAA